MIGTSKRAWLFSENRWVVRTGTVRTSNGSVSGQRNTSGKPAMLTVNELLVHADPDVPRYGI
ncbi:hypothetical protein [Paenibacillus xylaniclasticus]|uniref:hypothetical protein n=1 Tax=Paenibacillus xylaniclasticus TaxID=588083 RepID=UPI000FD9C993|nr:MULTISPECIES: hypothetical protein [Paenibacillus]GFN31205.1 hypothetical protein PCURB6_14650 [Paenibacillus curdlanolyticus]